MIHKLYTALSVHADEAEARRALGEMLRDEACVAGSVYPAIGRVSVQVYWSSLRGASVAASPSEEALAECERGEGWYPWRERRCCELAIERAQRLVQDGRDPLDAAEEASVHVAERLYGARDPKQIRICAMYLAELAAVQELRAGGSLPALTEARAS